MHGNFLRWNEGRNIYELDCPTCGVVGEIGVPAKSTVAFKHECGTLFVQKLTSGKNLYERPILETVLP
jgi:hypothetical protein